MLKRPNSEQALFLSGFLFATAKVASIIFDDLLYFEVFIFVVVIIPHETRRDTIHFRTLTQNDTYINARILF